MLMILLLNAFFFFCVNRFRFQTSVKCESLQSAHDTVGRSIIITQKDEGRKREENQKEQLGDTDAPSLMVADEVRTDSSRSNVMRDCARFYWQCHKNQNHFVVFCPQALQHCLFLTVRVRFSHKITGDHSDNSKSTADSSQTDSLCSLVSSVI